MNEKLSYPEEIFEWRKKKYEGRVRTKLPAAQQAEVADRVNRLVHQVTAALKFPDDFLVPGEEPTEGGKVPANLFDLDFQYDEVTGTVKVIGSGGSVVLDSSYCMVDVARYFLEFAGRESCGECTFCRIGTKRMSEIINRIAAGAGRPDDIPVLAELAEKVAETSLCEVGKLAAVPVKSTLKHFPKVYEEHIEGGQCRAGKCRLDG
jgi:hypothetical protein